ncbi:MAG: hypothetical protein ACFFFK_11255, partial [Candidatus Thorarchaeota archaeon]
MNMDKRMLFVLLSISLLTIPLGITAYTPTRSAATLTDAAIPAAEYDFVNRREPISVLVYNEYSDNLPGGEYDYTMAELKAEYGYTFEYDNLTDYTQLANVITNYDVLLLVEQEESSYAQMDAVAAEWSGFITGWVSDGGIVICLDYYSSGFGYMPTARILNNTGLMRIYNATDRTAQAVTITDSFDPLAFGVSAYTGPDGTVSFDTPDGDAIFSSGGQTVVANRYMGLGHVVMLGFDMYSTDSNPVKILGNAVRLTRLAVFDNSHAENYDPYSGFNDFATYIQTNWGFAIATMNSWDETLVGTCQVLVTGSNTAAPNPYSANEVAYVDDFVAAGGGLFMMSDIWWYGNSTDPLLAEFGFERNQTGMYASDIDDNEGTPGQPIYNATNIAKHAITFHVSEVQMFGSTAFTRIPANAQPLIWTDNDGTAVWSAGGDA